MPIAAKLTAVINSSDGWIAAPSERVKDVTKVAAAQLRSAKAAASQAVDGSGCSRFSICRNSLLSTDSNLDMASP